MQWVNRISGLVVSVGVAAVYLCCRPPSILDWFWWMR